MQRPVSGPVKARQSFPRFFVIPRLYGEPMTYRPSSIGNGTWIWSSVCPQCGNEFRPIILLAVTAFTAVELAGRRLTKLAERSELNCSLFDPQVVQIRSQNRARTDTMRATFPVDQSSMQWYWVASTSGSSERCAAHWCFRFLVSSDSTV